MFYKVLRPRCRVTVVYAGRQPSHNCKLTSSNLQISDRLRRESQRSAAFGEEIAPRQGDGGGGAAEREKRKMEQMRRLAKGFIPRGGEHASQRMQCPAGV